MKSLVTVNSSDAYLAAAIAGLGIVQVPRYAQSARVERGDLTPVLPRYTAAPLAVSLVHAHGKTVSRRVQVVMSWLADTLASQVERSHA
jgi:DNA-binding transcriptional LysR family regulator